MTLSPARAAIHAAKNELRWGSYAAARFALNSGASLSMWLTARRIERCRRLRAALDEYLA